jgi:hypothetical protein
MPVTHFRIGDRVRLLTGRSPQQIMKIREQQEQALLKYESSMHWANGRCKWRHFSEFTHYDPQPEEVIMSDNTPTLYETKDGHFGTLLARNSRGEMVLEIKPSGETKTFKPEDLTEVTPYTIAIKFDGSNSTIHFEVPEGSLVRGDLVIHGMNFGRVTDSDTKCRKPANLGGGGLRKLLSEKIV